MTAAHAGRASRASRRGGGNSLKGQRGRRLRPGKAIVWLFFIAVGAALVGIISLGLLIGFRWVTTNQYFALQNIVVSGCERLGADEVVDIAGISLGQNVLELKISDIEQRLTANPWTEMVMVRRVPPAELHITIKERRPVYWIRTVDGLAYADAAGRVIDSVGAEKLIPLPLLDVAETAKDDVSRLGTYLEGLTDSGVLLEPEHATYIRFGSRSVRIIFDTPALSLVVEREEWKRNMHRLGLVWSDLVRRGEVSGVRTIRVIGGKVFVRA